jgi:hypothetical protein
MQCSASRGVVVLAGVVSPSLGHQPYATLMDRNSCMSPVQVWVWVCGGALLSRLCACCMLPLPLPLPLLLPLLLLPLPLLLLLPPPLPLLLPPRHPG